MTGHSVQPRHRIFVKGYAFLSFTRNIWTNIGKNKGKNLSNKYSQKSLGHPKQIHLDLLQKEQFKKLQKQSDDLIGNKIADEIIKLSSNFSQTSRETVESETRNSKFCKKK